MYQVQLVSSQHAQDTVGQLTVDPTSNNGDMNVKLNTATIPNATLFAIFCPFANSNKNCFDVGSMTTDASGNLNSSFRFPKMGTWAGVFYISKDNAAANGQNTAYWLTESSAETGNFASGQTYRAPLQPEATVTGGISMAATSAPLTSGFISISGSTLRAEVHGAKPATDYVVSFCSNGGFTSSCNYYGTAGSFTTDASGNGSASVTVYSGPSEVFFVDPVNTRGNGYVTAFVVQ